MLMTVGICRSCCAKNVSSSTLLTGIAAASDQAERLHTLPAITSLVYPCVCNTVLSFYISV